MDTTKSDTGQSKMAQLTVEPQEWPVQDGYVNIHITIGEAPPTNRLLGTGVGAGIGLLISGLATKKLAYIIAGAVIGGVVGALAAPTITAKLQTLDDMPLLYPE